MLVNSYRSAFVVVSLACPDLACKGGEGVISFWPMLAYLNVIVNRCHVVFRTLHLKQKIIAVDGRLLRETFYW